ncbi:MAG: quinone-dependent dihydroorotate dehydrogenase [Armatimonadetes bacterium]|nr:quinone-dependent dihydroorotate dehydrogenase [Armatimonadota bacterium]
MYEKLLRPLLFRLDPERAHHLGLSFIARGLIRSRLVRDPRLAVTVMGLSFPNPLGLAAGFDKNGVALSRWAGLGFGFAEVGTVTPKAQPGNPKPRMFRLPAEQGLINRLGFNNDGAEALRRNLLASSQRDAPIGINLGKNKVTPDAEAANDYAESFALLEPYGDYFVINVSSPNTPGLRTLQDRGPLTEIIRAIRATPSTKPLLIKVAPDLTDTALEEIVDLAKSENLQGLIVSNTTIARDMLARDPEIAGGLSGRPVSKVSNHALSVIAASSKELCIIGVGGIFTATDLITKFELGADLTQIYTGWVYGGPQTCARILTDVLIEMDRRGLKHISEFRNV